MDTFLHSLIKKHKRKSVRDIAFNRKGNIRYKFQTSSIVTSFLKLSFEDLIQKANHELQTFVFLSKLQQLLNDPLVNKFHHWTLDDIDLKEVSYIPELRFYGSREPFRSKIPSKSIKSFQIAKMKYIKQILHVHCLIVLEPRNFDQETQIWNLVVTENKEQESIYCLPIPDWSLPTKEILYQFGIILNNNFVNHQQTLGHCIAGNGRTGICLMFVLMFTTQTFDFVKLLILLSQKYKLKAACEIVTIILKGYINLQNMFQVFSNAYELIKVNLDLTKSNLFPSNVIIPLLTFRSTFTYAEMKQFAKYNIHPRRNLLRSSLL